MNHTTGSSLPIPNEAVFPYLPTAPNITERLRDFSLLLYFFHGTVDIHSPSFLGDSDSCDWQRETQLNPDLLETHRYITGSCLISSSSSSSSASPSPSPAEDACAGVSAWEVAAVAVMRLFLACGRDCFFSRRLMVSAWRRK